MNVYTYKIEINKKWKSKHKMNIDEKETKKQN